MKPERLDKLLAAQTPYSRKAVRGLVRQGAVRVNGEPAKAADQKIDLERDRVELFGKPLALTRFSYLMLNKPEGVVSATRDGRDRTVLDLVPDELRRDGLFPAGRLDKDTTGFVLITNDGAFAHRILSPKSHVPKTYRAQLDLPIDEEIIRRFEEGFALERDVTCKPACLRVLETGAQEWVEVILVEGMYHQIKRMFEHFGRRVLALQRVRMGALDLDTRLAPGQCRLLTPDEVAKITESCGENG